MPRIRVLLSALFLVLLLPTHSQSQSIPDLIKGLGIETLARDYLRPAADAVGYGINSGWYHTARIDDGFHIWAGVRAVWTVVPETDRTFEAVLPADLTALGYPARIQTATIFGANGAQLRSSFKDPGGNPYPDIQLPGGTDLKSTMIPVPHVEIGGIAATSVILRGIPRMTVDPAIGDVSFWGVGLRHSPTNYLRLPVDFSILAAMQKFEIATLADVTTMSVSAQASVTTGILTLFAGTAFESYDIKAHYTYTPPAGTTLPGQLSQPVALDLAFKRSNRRFTVGAALTILPLVDLTADYSFGIQDNITFGAGVTF